jgi:hypothetical protein
VRSVSFPFSSIFHSPLFSTVAVDCDEDQNKPLCGEYGIQGALSCFPRPSSAVLTSFSSQVSRLSRRVGSYRTSIPSADLFTLQIFPGGKAPPRSAFLSLAPLLSPDSDPLSPGYDGPRETKDIITHLTSSMPTFVKPARTAKEVEALREKVRSLLSSLHSRLFLTHSHLQATSKPVSLLFTSAGKVTPLYKALSTDFRRTIDFFAARDAKVGEDAYKAFGVETLPALLVIDGSEVKKYEGALSPAFLCSRLKFTLLSVKNRSSQVRQDPRFSRALLSQGQAKRRREEDGLSRGVVDREGTDNFKVFDEKRRHENERIRFYTNFDAACISCCTTDGCSCLACTCACQSFHFASCSFQPHLSSLSFLQRPPHLPLSLCAITAAAFSSVSVSATLTSLTSCLSFL